MTTTLTDRYVWAVVRLLPDRQRAEVDRELRELVGEATDAHRDGIADPSADPEYAALVELGDPNRLAARYVEHPRALVSEDQFPAYLRVLKVVLAIAVPVVIALSVLGALVSDDDGAAHVIGAGLVGGYHAAIQTAFWVTLAYAFARRWQQPWTPADLPELANPGMRASALSIGDLVFGIIATVLAGVALVWQHVAPFVHDRGGEGVPALHPDIWYGAAQVLLVALAASLVVQVVVLVRRRWTMPLAIVNAAINALSLGVVAWLALDDRLINPDLLVLIADRAELGRVPTVNAWIPIVLIGAVEIWDTLVAFRAVRRSGDVTESVKMCG